MSKLSLICPTRQRPERFAAMINSLKWSCDDWYTGGIELIVGLDGHDPAYSSYRDYAASELCGFGAIAVNRMGHDISLSEWTNMMVAGSTGEIICLIADDIIIKTPRWTNIVRQAMFSDGLGVLFPLDMYNNKCTFPIFHRRMVDIQDGVCVPTEIQRWFIDEWYADIGARTKRLRRLDDVVFEHIHPFAGKAPTDDVYDLALMTDIPASDKKAFESDELTQSREEIADRINEMTKALTHAKPC